MAVSAAGIVTPDDNDDWDLVVDLALMALSIDAAIANFRRSAAGSGVVINAAGGNATTTQEVLFPSGRFTTTPSISIQNYSPLSTHSSVAIRPTTANANSFVVNVYNTSSSATTVTVGWIAVQA